MFCGKCGKEMDSSAKFCPHCGEKNPNAGLNAAAGKQALPTPSMNGKLPQAVTVVCSVLHILMYYKLSYAKWYQGNDYIRTAAAYLGIEIPRKLTAQKAIRIMEVFDELGVQNAEEVHLELVIICMLPIVFGIISALLVLFTASKKTAVVPIVLSAFTVMDYWVISQGLSAYKDFGYVMGKGWLLACLVTLIQLGAAIMYYKATSKK